MIEYYIAKRKDGKVYFRPRCPKCGIYLSIFYDETLRCWVVRDRCPCCGYNFLEDE